MNSTPLTHEKLRFYRLDQAHPGQALVNLPLAIALHGPLDVEALAWAVRELGRRTPLLRSAIVMCEGQAYQVTTDLELKLEIEDYSTLDEDERARFVAKRRALEARRPFDHERAPLVRFFLFRQTPERAAFSIVTTRVILDEVSFEPLLSELKELYETRTMGREPPRDSGLRLAKLSAADAPTPARASEEQRVAYWRERLAGMPPKLALGPDRPRPAELHGCAHQVSLSLGAPETRALQELADTQGVTLESIALAALELVLARMSGQADFGITVHGSGRDELEARVGMLENPVIVRSDVPAGGSFGELCWRVESSRNEAFAYQDLAFDTLAHRVLGEQDLDELPLHQLAFRLRAGPGSLKRLGAAEIESLASTPRVTTVELSFWIERPGSVLHVGVDAMSELYHAETAARLCRAWRYVMANAPLYWSMELEDVELTSASEQRAWAEALNARALSRGSDALVHRLFERAVDATPTRTALSFGDSEVAFRELDERANAIAHALRRRGVGPEVLVGVHLERGPDLVASLLGVLKAGGAYVPLDPSYPRETLSHWLAESHAQVLITTEELATRLGSTPELLLLDRDAHELEQSPVTRLGEPEASQQLAYVIYTSGTTGTPKGVMVEHRNVVSFLEAIASPVGLDRDGVWLAGSSIGFDISVLELLGALCYGQRVVLLGAPLEQATDVSELVQRHGVTHLQCTPSQVKALLMHEANRRALAKLDVLMLGGEELPQALADELHLLLKGRLLNLYGPTEATVYATCAELRPRELVTIGEPLTNTAVFVVDERGRLAPPGAVGELCLAGPGVARGYFEQPELSRERFVENRFFPAFGPVLYRTGDLVRSAPDGRLVYLGRNDDQVKFKGLRLELRDIEAVLRLVPGVEDAVVTARDTSTDKTLVAYVVPSDDYPGPGRAREQLRDALPAFLLPSSILSVPLLPLLPNGKVDRQALPEPPALGEGLELLGPRNATEAALSDIWQGALGLPRIGVNENFFDLGGQSLAASKIADEVERAFGVRLSASALLEAPTIEALAARLGPTQPEHRTAIVKSFSTVVPIQPRGSRPPVFCVAGPGGTPMNLRPLALALGDDQPFYGLQMRGVDGQYPPHRDLCEMAAEFLRDIRAVQPHGPYFLAGYSTGGLAAYELAQQLRAAGESVGLVVLFDTQSPAAPWSIVERLDAHLRSLRQRGAVGHLARRARACMRGEVGRLRRRWRARLAPLFPFQFRNDAVWVATEQAASRYRALPYAGDVLLLAGDPEFDASAERSVRPSPTRSWSALVQGRFEVVRLSAGERELIDERACRMVAEALRSALRRALARVTMSERPLELPSSEEASPPERRESRRVA